MQIISRKFSVESLFCIDLHLRFFHVSIYRSHGRQPQSYGKVVISLAVDRSTLIYYVIFAARRVQPVGVGSVLDGIHVGMGFLCPMCYMS
jgi:hypothetical protein